MKKSSQNYFCTLLRCLHEKIYLQQRDWIFRNLIFPLVQDLKSFSLVSAFIIKGQCCLTCSGEIEKNEMIKNIIKKEVFLSSNRVLECFFFILTMKFRYFRAISLQIFIIFPDSTKLKIVWIKITTFFKRRVSIILWSFSS